MAVRTPDQRKYGRPATGPAGRPALEKCKKPRTGRGFLRIDRGRADDPFRYIGFSTVCKKPVFTGFFHIIILNLFEVSELPLFQKFNGSLDVLVHHPVLAVEWYDRAEFGQEVFQICRCFRRPLHINGLRGIH